MDNYEKFAFIKWLKEYDEMAGIAPYDRTFGEQDACKRLIIALERPDTASEESTD